MLILSLTYIKSTQEADVHMQPHLAWVKEGYDKGWFLASGRKIPRTGGVILAVAEDPFTIHGICTYEITEVALTTVVDGLEALKG
ncbi:MAG: GTP cyclohydrolase [Rhizobium sp. 63-7]|nr:MAG: GTP cyclohydrolase [Rhizobium sp. 63-7]